MLQRCLHSLAELLAQTETVPLESDRLVRPYLTAIRDDVNAVLGDSRSPYLLDQNQGRVYRVESDRP